MNSCLAVQGRAHTVGSSTVTAYSSEFGPVRVQRSTMCRFSRDPWKSVFGLKFVTSITRVLPSQWPRESPYHWRMLAGTWGLPSIDDIALPPLALADVVEHRDAAGRLHDSPEADAIGDRSEGADLRQPAHQAAHRQRGVLRTIIAIDGRRVVARRGFRVSRRGRRIVLASGTWRLFVLAGFGRLQQPDSKFAFGGGALLRLRRSEAAAGHWADRRSATSARRCASWV